MSIVVINYTLDAIALTNSHELNLSDVLLKTPSTASMELTKLGSVLSNVLNTALSEPALTQFVLVNRLVVLTKQWKQG